MASDKYRFDYNDFLDIEGHRVYRIYATQDMEDIGIKAGDCGGYIENEGNLSRKGNAWVYDGPTEISFGYGTNNKPGIVFGEAQVMGDASVGDGAIVKDEAVLLDDATATYGAEVSGKSVLCDLSYVVSSSVHDCSLHGRSNVVKNANVNNTEMYNDSSISGNYSIVSHCTLRDESRILEGIVFNSSLSGKSTIDINSRVDVSVKSSELSGNSVISGYVSVLDCKLDGNVKIDGYLHQFGSESVGWKPSTYYHSNFSGDMLLSGRDSHIHIQNVDLSGNFGNIFSERDVFLAKAGVSNDAIEELKTNLSKGLRVENNSLVSYMDNKCYKLDSNISVMTNESLGFRSVYPERLSDAGRLSRLEDGLDNMARNILAAQHGYKATIAYVNVPAEKVNSVVKENNLTYDKLDISTCYKQLNDNLLNARKKVTAIEVHPSKVEKHKEHLVLVAGKPVALVDKNGNAVNSHGKDGPLDISYISGKSGIENIVLNSERLPNTMDVWRRFSQRSNCFTNGFTIDGKLVENVKPQSKLNTNSLENDNSKIKPFSQAKTSNLNVLRKPDDRNKPKDRNTSITGRGD